jgi:hypothetical protein
VAVEEVQPDAAARAFALMADPQGIR